VASLKKVEYEIQVFVSKSEAKMELSFAAALRFGRETPPAFKEFKRAFRELNVNALVGVELVLGEERDAARPQFCPQQDHNSIVFPPCIYFHRGMKRLRASEGERGMETFVYFGWGKDALFSHPEYVGLV
jgi:hypothetical protein